MDKQIIENACRKAGLTPATREKRGDYDIFIADGFSEKPYPTFKRFGVEKHEFPNGAFCTIWFVAKGEDKFDVGQPLLFEPDHDPQYDKNTKRTARINTAKAEAHGFLNTRKKVKLDA